MVARILLSVLLACVLTACSSGDSTGVAPVSAVQLNRGTANLAVGDSVLLVATTKDADGNTLSGRQVSWNSTAGGVATVSAAGWVKAVGGGNATITATSENVSAQAQVAVTAPVSTVALNLTTTQIAVGDSVRLLPTLRDANQNVLSGRAITWATNNASVATVSSTGWVKGLTAGIAQISATAEGIVAEAQVAVTSDLSLTISSITPDIMVAGGTAILTGAGFSATPGDNSVMVGGVAATVTAASTSQLTVSIPPSASFPCLATHNATVSVSITGANGSRAHPLQVATQRSLGAGESIAFSTAGDARCNEFAQTGGRYFVTVARPDNTIGAVSAFTLRGQAATATASAHIMGEVPDPRPMLSTGAAAAGMNIPFARVSPTQERTSARKHREILEENLRLPRVDVARFRRSAAQTGRPSLSLTKPSFTIGTLGDTNDVKIPNRNLPPGTSTCQSAPIVVRARTVYSGTRSIILEDVASPLNGQIDAYYQALGQEFDNVMYPIVTANFGDPLAVDALTDANGKLVMLFSKRINDFGGINGFVTTCDFFDPVIFPELLASNKAEIFYAVAPTSAAMGFDSDPNTVTRDEWRQTIRGTLIHEAKHLAMFAEFFADDAATTLEESWLEEGMAMHAEELYSRTITGATWKGNTGYGAGQSNHIWCEVRAGNSNFPQCADRPYVMTSHFAFLAQYLGDIENRTIAGGLPGNSGDGSFYGSSWAFVRWMVDAYAASESAVLKDITLEGTLTGAANLSARSGVPYETMMSQFHYALQYDDVAGVTPTAPWQHISSWSIAGIYGGFNVDFPQSFPAIYLKDHGVNFGTFAVVINTLRGGTAAHVEITGAQSAKQLLSLQAQNGGAPPSELRMTVFRVQ